MKKVNWYRASLNWNQKNLYGKEDIPNTHTHTWTFKKKWNTLPLKHAEGFLRIQPEHHCSDTNHRGHEVEISQRFQVPSFLFCSSNKKKMFFFYKLKCNSCIERHKNGTFSHTPRCLDNACSSNWSEPKTAEIDWSKALSAIARKWWLGLLASCKKYLIMLITGL